MKRALLVLALGACAPERPPLGEALVVVDTDVTVPRGVNRLRVDLYAEDTGRWFESRDISRPDPRDWPVSFSVFSRDEEEDSLVWLRLRAYPDGRVRDVQVPGRLADTEPIGALSVDRLLLLRLEPGLRGRAIAELSGSCAGLPADLSGRSCVGGELVDVLEQGVEPEIFDVPESLLSTGSIDCSPSDDPAHVCIRAGASILGSAELFLYPDLEPVPERLVIHEPFHMDRDEVTVGRFRAALASGLVPDVMPTANEGPLGSDVASACTWSSLDQGRESYALSCLTWDTARAFCQHVGGDLPTEAQFERAASLASDFGHSRYPWGDETPSCDRAVYGRLALAGFPGVCEHVGSGPLPVEAQALDATREGVVGLGGGVGEWMRDDAAPYTDACWASASARDPLCVDETKSEKSVRGGSWAAPPTILPRAVRQRAERFGRASFIGFRCVYP